MDGDDFYREASKPKRAPSWAAKLRRHSSLHSSSSPVTGEAYRRRSSRFDRSQVTSCYDVDAMIEAEQSFRFDAPPVPAIDHSSVSMRMPQVRTYSPLLPEPSPSVTPESRRTSGSDRVDPFTPIEVSKGLQYDNIWRTLPPSGGTLAVPAPRPMPTTATMPNLRASRSADPMSPRPCDDEPSHPRKGHYSDCDQYTADVDSQFGELIIHRSQSVGEDSAYDDLNVEDAEIVDTETILTEHNALLKAYGAGPGDQHEEMLSIDYYNTLAQEYRDIAMPAGRLWDDSPVDEASVSDIRFVPKPLFFANEYQGAEEVLPVRKPAQNNRSIHSRDPSGDDKHDSRVPSEGSRVSRLSRTLSRRLSLHHRKTSSGQSIEDKSRLSRPFQDEPRRFELRESYSPQIERTDPVQRLRNDSRRGPPASLQLQTTNSTFASSIKNTLKRISPTLNSAASISQIRHHERQPSSTIGTPSLRQDFAHADPPASRWTLGAVQKARHNSSQYKTEKAARASMPAPKTKGIALSSFVGGLVEARDEIKRKQRRNEIKNSIRVVGQADSYADVEFVAPKQPPAGWI